MPHLEWHGDEAASRIRKRSVQFLTRAAIAVSRRAKELLSVAGTGSGGRDSQGRFKRVYGANPSKPGEPPRKQTGRLRASVSYEVDEGSLSARVGTNVDYGRILEVERNRPWLKRALAETSERVNELLGQIETD